MSFLTEEFRRYHIAISATVDPPALIDDWALRRDDAGFVITAPAEAHPAIRTYLEGVFAGAKFDNSGTLIYRNDEHHTTAMLNREDHQTQLIVLFWRDPVVQSRLVETQMNAIKQVVADVENRVAEVQRLFEEAEAETDDVQKSALFEKARTSSEELRAYLGTPSVS